ncbi:hypothetical protein NDU88_007925 [Pleurodeles waltl]|uniref:Uncharacterized protein n=1 Tax=Pleurodeles waltl TaxID=8319 RepID=A0AAV7VVS9_PLEWA|nr:hypothetical protein NDU88_007925 [Pleurodeles waltl]
MFNPSVGQFAQHGVTCGLEHEVLVEDVELDYEEDNQEEGEIVEVAGLVARSLGRRSETRGGGNLIVFSVLVFRDSGQRHGQRTIQRHRRSHTGQAPSFREGADFEAR